MLHPRAACGRHKTVVDTKTVSPTAEVGFHNMTQTDQFLVDLRLLPGYAALSEAAGKISFVNELRH